jgi:cytoskeletal protein RodZ
MLNKREEMDMSNYTQRSRRSNRGNRTNKILNILIGIVLILIIVTLAFIFVDGGGDDQASDSDTESINKDVSDESDDPEGKEEQQNENTSTETPTEGDSSEQSSEDEQQEDSDTEKAENTESVTLPDDTQAIEEPSDDPIVEKTITNPSWKPIGTSQSGEHVSSYDKESVDWTEKEKALSYATGLAQDNMIVWFIGNGGGPQKSIGTVSSKDKSQKYRVYLQWVDGEGWKPEKMDVLNTLEGAKP